MKICSGLFHPLLMASYLSTLLLLQAPELLPRVPASIAPQFLLIVFVITFLMPSVSILLLRSFSVISNLEVTERKERIWPFLFIGFYYLAATYLFAEKLDMGPLFMLVMASVSILILLLTALTTFVKVSIHAAAIWCGIGYVAAIAMYFPVNLGYTIYALIVAGGLTCASRLYLGYHTPKEVWLGTILGITYGLGVIVVFT